ncbi:non-homologous end-joining DNA ligase [Propioniciclava soli]|uniref:non-homologous end-joining DNA ligase n=1 Tax=Propioniciclava soli TaxID=2775081 RepID=UPI001E399CAE|nr:non-homologous end-joining DNA ligase [Propioniciclava soli]
MSDPSPATTPWPAGLSAPARRALEAAGYARTSDLTRARFIDLAGLHGVGPKALDLLSAALTEAGLDFAEPAPRSQQQWRRAMGTARPAGTGEDAAREARRRSAAAAGAASTPKAPPVVLDVGGRDVRISSPDRVYFPETGWTKLDVVQYYLAVGPGILRALRDRPTMLHRFPKGLAGEKVFQKRLPSGAPPWVTTVRLHFPRFDLHADELCPTELAEIAWAGQMSTVEFHPWNVRRSDVDAPDEWRIDIDPMPDAGWDRVVRVAGAVRATLDELGVTGYPKTSGGNGIHVYVRIPPDRGFAEVRRAAWAFAVAVEERLPDDVTTAWWRRDRRPDQVFLDYNQNARDHTLASAYSLRGNPRGTVSTPFRWDELDALDPRDFTLATVPGRFAELGDLMAGIDDEAFSLDALVEQADRLEADGRSIGSLPEPG